MLQVGEKAPAFALPDAQGNLVTLESLQGKRFVLYFYPKDATPGCTRQACAFASHYAAYQALGVPVIGVSKDTQGSHQRFADKNALPFILLSDPQLTAIMAYDVWKEKKLYGKVSMGVVRTTYIIGPDGVVEWAKEKVKPDDNAQEVLQVLQQK